MSPALTHEDYILAELRAIVRSGGHRREGEARHALFDALADLERRAGISGVSDPVLGRVAEIRFLAGILREAVFPIRHQTARRARQAWATGPDACEPAL